MTGQVIEVVGREESEITADDRVSFIVSFLLSRQDMAATGKNRSQKKPKKFVSSKKCRDQISWIPVNEKSRKR